MAQLTVVADRAWRGYADLRRRIRRSGSAGPALASLGAPDRSDLERWMERTRLRHDAYREANPVPAGRTAIVCVSIRPHLLDHVVANIARQDQLPSCEVVFVANSDGFDRAAVERACSPLGAVTIVQPPRGTSLGAALNRGMERTDARFVAKFDDDDHYGPRYLSDALRPFGYAGAGVTGKHTSFARFVDTGETFLRFPGNEFRYSGTLGGATLVIDRDVVGDQRFDDISLGEDRAFLARCHRRGISTFAADRFNFVYSRGTDNTWRVATETYLDGALRVDGADIDR